MAMNEKFKKDEVWGYLGKSNKSQKEDKGRDGNVGDEDNSDYEESAELHQIEAKPVYNKDDFFDALSCSANHDPQNGRTRFSVQAKIDTETFGDFSRDRGGRGFRGGHGRAFNYGNRGGRVYGYAGWGWGRAS